MASRGRMVSFLPNLSRNWRATVAMSTAEARGLQDKEFTGISCPGSWPSGAHEV